jgi:hypothetical protein
MLEAGTRLSVIWVRLGENCPPLPPKNRGRVEEQQSSRWIPFALGTLLGRIGLRSDRAHIHERRIQDMIIRMGHKQ